MSLRCAIQIITAENAPYATARFAAIGISIIVVIVKFYVSITVYVGSNVCSTATAAECIIVDVATDEMNHCVLLDDTALATAID